MSRICGTSTSAPSAVHMVKSWIQTGLSAPAAFISNGISLMTLSPKFSSDGSTVESAILSFTW